MHNAYSGLAKALGVSLVLHAALIAAGMPAGAPIKPALRPAQAELRVSLREPLAVPNLPNPAALAPARPVLPEEPQRNASAIVAVSTVRTRAAAPQPLQGEAALKASEQLQRELYYPVEAIERGLQGDALVLLFLDGSGTVIAARLEGSSGHALLDEAAVRAASSLRALPPGAPREALLPVRFRLR
jgi:protein TonB